MGLGWPSLPAFAQQQPAQRTRRFWWPPLATSSWQQSRAAVPAAVAALAVAALALAVLGVGVAVVGVGVAAPPGLCPTAARATHPEVLVAAPRDLFLAAVRAAVPVAAAAMALAVLGVCGWLGWPPLPAFAQRQRWSLISQHLYFLVRPDFAA